MTWIARALSAPPRIAHATRLLLPATAAAGLLLVGWGQYCVTRRRSPFDWPYTSWLNQRFVHAFHTQNTLAFAAPLFVVGGLFVALATPRANEQSVGTGQDGRRLRIRYPFAAFALAAVSGWAWLNVRLYEGHYEPSYRWIFFASIGAAGLTLAAFDMAVGRLRWPRLTRRALLEALVVAAVTGTFIGINVRDLASWRYAAVGDEGTFWHGAEAILHQSRLNWFSERGGPFDVQAVLGTVWHAINLRLFGEDQFGWRMGSLTSIAVVFPMFYWLLRQTLGVRVALFGTLFLGASHYLFSYAHTGYNNVFPIFPTVAALALFFAGMKRASYALLFAAGVSAGFGFYTFWSSRATIGILGAILLTMGWRQLRPGVLGAIGAGWAMTVLPLFATDGWRVISNMDQRSFTQSNTPIVEHLEGNFVRTLFAFNFNPNNVHYTAGALMDAVSVTFAVAGFFLCLIRVRQLGYRMVIIWFASAAVVTGVLSQYDIVTISRLHYALPAVAAFAGIAVDRVLAAGGAVIQRPRVELVLSVGAFIVLAPALFIINGEHFFNYSARHSPTTEETVILREFMAPACDGQPLRSIAYMPNPDLVLHGLWPLFHEDAPIEVAYRDQPFAYGAYPAYGGIGCAAAAFPSDTTAAATVSQLQAGDAVTRTVTDLTGATRVTLSPAPGDAGSLTPDALRAVWPTDFSKGEGLGGIVKGQEKDAIGSIDNPVFTPAVDGHLAGPESVVVVTIGTQARAYPQRTLIWRNVVNDVLAGVPIAVAFDPIAGAARVYRRDASTFGTTGLLRGGNALLYDRGTQTWWQQLTGQAIVGARAGTQLEVLPSTVASFEGFKAAYPNGQVMQPPTDLEHAYDHQPYLDYDTPNGKPIYSRGQVDTRLPAMRHVALIDVDGRHIAVPFPREGTKSSGVRTLDVGGDQIVLFFDWRTLSELDSRGVADSRRVGSIGTYRPAYQGRQLTFGQDPNPFVDAQTHSVWDVLGRSAVGPAAGSQLEPVMEVEGFWFSIAAAYPDAEVMDLFGQ